MGCFERPGSLKQGFRRLGAALTRSRPSNRPLNIGHPTDFKKESDPFSSMVALPGNREYIEKEGLTNHETSLLREPVRTGGESSASSVKENISERVVDVVGDGPSGLGEALSSTTGLVGASDSHTS